MSANFLIDCEGDVVAWVLPAVQEHDAVVEAVSSITSAVAGVKQQYGTVRIIVDNFSRVNDGVSTAYPKPISDKWGELQQWFLTHLEKTDKIAVMQGSATLKIQMARLGKQSGLAVIEKQFFAMSYEATKQQAYDYLGITSNALIDGRAANISS